MDNDGRYVTSLASTLFLTLLCAIGFTRTLPESSGAINFLVALASWSEVPGAVAVFFLDFSGDGASRGKGCYCFSFWIDSAVVSFSLVSTIWLIEHFWP